MFRKFIFKSDSILLVGVCLLPAVFIYAKDLVPWFVETPLIIFSSILVAIWYWQINRAIDDLTEERKIQKLLYGFILIDLLLSFSMVVLFQRNIRELFLEREGVLFWKGLIIGMRILVSVILAILATIRLRKILYERTTWFMFMELLVPILGIINITPLMKEELENKNLI